MKRDAAYISYAPFDLELLASLVPPEERDAYLASLRATQRPQGWAALEQPWPGRSLPDVSRTYVLCTEDQIIPPARQREMAARLGVKPIEIASEHAVFTFRPRELGTRVPVQALFEYLEGKHSLDEFLDDFPTVSREQAVAVLEQARELVLSGARAA